jgi:predicted nucleic-acid-binding Zn-ribbon protein
MKSKITCPKCGSPRIIQQIQVMDRSDSGNQSLSLRRGTRALGGWLKLPRSFPLDAWTCGACGYTELYVREPAELLAADEASLRPPAGTAGVPVQPGSQAGDQARTMIFIALVAAMILALGLLAVVAVFLTR